MAKSAAGTQERHGIAIRVANGLPYSVNRIHAIPGYVESETWRCSGTDCSARMVPCAWKLKGKKDGSPSRSRLTPARRMRTSTSRADRRSARTRMAAAAGSHRFWSGTPGDDAHSPHARSGGSSAATAPTQTASPGSGGSRSAIACGRRNPGSSARGEPAPTPARIPTAPTAWPCAPPELVNGPPGQRATPANFANLVCSIRVGGGNGSQQSAQLATSSSARG